MRAGSKTATPLRHAPSRPHARTAELAACLPPPFRDWFVRRGWQPRPHQVALLDKAAQRRSTLLIAPTGSGKTLAGFLPSLTALAGRRRPRGERAVHTLYISPLKALAADVARNLLIPLEEMGLPITVETRTGDTSVSLKQRQRRRPPEILLTTPEQVALLLSHADAPRFLAGLETVILDELHALAPTKRGDLLALDLARLAGIAPRHMRIGLSATVARPSELRAYLTPQATDGVIELADLVTAEGGAAPDIGILDAEQPLPWAGHTTRYALPEILAAIKAHRLSLVFVNTRSQAELLFQELWRINDDALPIALHHGSLDATRRRKVEAAMAAGTLKAVVATSTLDLGVDWGDVDLVIHVGAPKGASRLIQRVGRANHRLDEPSRAVLVPSNRFEVLECSAAIEAAAAGAQDAVQHRTGALDVLAQHVWGTACAGPFHPDALFCEVRAAAPYAGLTRSQFDRILDFVSTGGYALRVYERYARLKPAGDGLLRLAHPRLAQQYRMNVGTIVEAPMIKIRLVGRRPRHKPGTPRPLFGGRVLGELEEYFIEQLSVGDTFAFAGEVLRFEGLQETEALVSRTHDSAPKIPAYGGGKFPLSTHLAERVRRMLASREHWRALPDPVSEWLGQQAERSTIPDAGEVLVETFPRGNRHFLVVYPFEGRLAHQTLGMLLTRRLDRIGAKPLGFVANDYALAAWTIEDMTALSASGRLDIAGLFDEDMLGDDLEAWLAESSLMKRTFRICAVIAGLIERRHPGKTARDGKTGRQITVSSDLIYDVLRRHDPHHILLEAAWADAATGLLDIARLGDFLRRIKGHIRYKSLDRVSPLAVPVLLEIGRELVYGGNVAEGILREAADDLVREAMQRG
ncbi:MAG: ligase-associated DNA damage response DEXH box helicase [Hyphomicrobiaceae bacterium]|nr:MAG: ligase-associated DNA damage response DEXH box helicase [Hyphomicrobiaceae bacterium]